MAKPTHAHTPDCPTFRITALPGGVVEVEVCWDQIDTPGIARALRVLADGLDALPPGTNAVGVIPLFAKKEKE